MRTVAVIGHKGGTGKTTLSIGLAVVAEMNGMRVVVLDIDTQASAVEWFDRREKVPGNGLVVWSYQAARIHDGLAAAAAHSAELVIIDTAGSEDAPALAAARAADLVLIPLPPVMIDLVTVGKARDIVAIAGKPRSYVVINRAPPQGPRHTEAIAWIAEQGVGACPVVIHQRIAHADAGNVGQAAADYDPRGKAAIEMADLFNFVYVEAARPKARVRKGAA